VFSHKLNGGGKAPGPSLGRTCEGVVGTLNEAPSHSHAGLHLLLVMMSFQLAFQRFQVENLEKSYQKTMKWCDYVAWCGRTAVLACLFLASTPVALALDGWPGVAGECPWRFLSVPCSPRFDWQVAVRVAS
jgi:hypothetical protein